MAPLTWRNVDSPSFASANDMYRLSASLLNSGFDAANAGIDRFRQTTTEEQSAALMSAVMGASSPQAIQAAVSGANPAFLSGEALRFANAQTGVNLGNTQAQQAIDMNAYTQGRNQTLDQRQDEAYARTNAMAVQEFSDWNEKNANTATAEQLVQQATNSFGSMGKDAVMTQLRNLAGKGVSNDVLQAAITLANSQDFLPSAGPSATDQVLKDLGLPVPQRQAPQYDTGWAGGIAGVPMGPTGTGSAAPASLVQNESGGNWEALNSGGYGGRLQFGTDRLADAANAGIIPKGTTGADFSKMSPQQQLAVENWHFADIDQKAADNGLQQYYGQTIGGVVITPDAIRSMSHLGGFEGAKKFIETNGQYNPADSNGTRLSDYGQRHGNGGGPTNANAAFLAETGVNPLDSNAMALLQSMGLEGPRRNDTAIQTALDTAAATDPNTPPPDVQAARRATEQFNGDFTAPLAQPGAGTLQQQAVNANLERTAEEPEATIALPTPEEILRGAIRPEGFTTVDPNASAFTQNQQENQRRQDIDNAINQISNDARGGGLADITNPVNGLLDYFSQTPEQGAANAAAREEGNQASQTIQDNADFFRQNPDEIAKARDNPVEYAQNFGSTAAQKAFLEQRAQNAADAAPSTATTAEATPARSDMSPQERALSDRTDSLAPLAAPTVLASENTNVPIKNVLSTLIAQGTADQTANIYGALDRLVANPPTEGVDPESVARAMFNQQEGLGAGEKIAYNDILSSITSLVQRGGVTAPMAAEIIKYSMDTGGRDWTPNRWLGGNKQINMETAEATRKAYLGTDAAGNVNTAPAARALERAQEVQTAMTKLNQFQQAVTQLEANKVALQSSDLPTAEKERELAEIEAALAGIRAATQQIEATGILSNYSKRQSN